MRAPGQKKEGRECGMQEEEVGGERRALKKTREEEGEYAGVEKNLERGALYRTLAPALLRRPS